MDIKQNDLYVKDGVSIFCETKDEETVFIAEVNGHKDGEPLTIDQDEAYAEHIVACVNGCKGINPEAIKEMINALKKVILREKAYFRKKNKNTQNLLNEERAVKSAIQVHAEQALKAAGVKQEELDEIDKELDEIDQDFVDGLNQIIRDSGANISEEELENFEEDIDDFLEE